MLCFGLTEPARHQTLKSAADLRTRNRIVKADANTVGPND